MAPKLKTSMKPTKKGLTIKIRKRAQPPPDLLSSEDESEPTLRDVMKALDMLNTYVTATEEKVATSSRLTPVTSPLTEQATKLALPPQ